MNGFMAEFIGTALLILLGDGVVANVVLHKSKGNNSGWIVISFGWAIAVFVGVFASVKLGGRGHLNPAVTLAMAWMGSFPWEQVPGYIAAQLGGAFTGALMVWLSYVQHFKGDNTPEEKLGVFCTAPAIRGTLPNLITEIIGTIVLILGANLMIPSEVKLGTLDALPVALLVLGIGLSLGGPTGYAINPARDLGPRIAHLLLPIPGKRDSDWGYSWIPVLGPIIGGLLAALLFKALV
jgi:glycerol uptake facilitator protein